VFVGSSATHVGEPTDLEESGRVGWIPMSATLGLITNGEVLGSGSLVGPLPAGQPRLGSSREPALP